MKYTNKKQTLFGSIYFNRVNTPWINVSSALKLTSLIFTPLRIRIRVLHFPFRPLHILTSVLDEVIKLEGPPLYVLPIK